MIHYREKQLSFVQRDNEWQNITSAHIRRLMASTRAIVDARGGYLDYYWIAEWFFYHYLFMIFELRLMHSTHALIHVLETNTESSF